MSKFSLEGLTARLALNCAGTGETRPALALFRGSHFFGTGHSASEGPPGGRGLSDHDRHSCGTGPPRCEGRPSTHRNNDFSLGTSTFAVGPGIGNVCKRICLVDDDLQFSLLDEFGELSEIATAWMHEKIAIADPCAASPRSDAVADEPEDGRKSPAAAQIPDRGLRFWNSGD